jgi:acyl carrier protein
MDTLLRLRRLLAEVLGIDEGEVLPDSSVVQLFDQHGGDSLVRVEFIMALEEEFDDLEFSDEEAESWEELIPPGTVQQLAESIDRRRRPPG